MAHQTRVGILLAMSATTGWADWMHGELWLFPDGLLRIPLGWMKTCLHSFGMGYNYKLATRRAFTDDEFFALISDRRIIWIPADMLVGAELRHTFGADELRAQLADGRAIQLLWLPLQGAFDALQQPLYEWVGSRLIVH